MFVDTHCHLDFNRFDDDRAQIIQRACNAGVEWLINPGINLESSQKAVKLAEQYPEVLAAIGIHPNEALTWNDNTLTELRRLAHHPKVVAIGEIGLDYYRDYSPRVLQVRIFKEQLDLAAQLGLPVIIHNRQAADDLLRILLDWRSHVIESSPTLFNRLGVLHAFSEDDHMARKALALGFFLGIGGPVTYQNSENLKALVANLDMTRILIETDSPYLTPHPLRGQRNEPGNVRLIAEKVSELRNEKLEEIGRQTSNNARSLFQW